MVEKDLDTLDQSQIKLVPTNEKFLRLVKESHADKERRLNRVTVALSVVDQDHNSIKEDEDTKNLRQSGFVDLPKPLPKPKNKEEEET